MGAESFRQVLDQRSDIGPLRAAQVERDLRAFDADQLERVYAYAARRPLHVQTRARQLVQTTALVLERRMHRRNLVNGPVEFLQHAQECFAVERRYGRLRDDFPVGIARIRLDSEATRDDVALVGVEQEGGDLGRFAETER